MTDQIIKALVEALEGVVNWMKKGDYFCDCGKPDCNSARASAALALAKSAQSQNAQQAREPSEEALREAIKAYMAIKKMASIRDAMAHALIRAYAIDFPAITPAGAPDVLSQAVLDVIAERQRQIAKGWTPEHDDGHVNGEIVSARGWGATSRISKAAAWSEQSPERRELLVEAAAQCIAEIERLDRAASNQGGRNNG